MDKNDLKQKYDQLVAGIESAKMFDGRNSGVDIYVCEKCGKQFCTRYKDKGVTPFTIKCRRVECGATMIHRGTISEQEAEHNRIVVHNWVRPTFEQLLTLDAGAQDHVLRGGLILEEELGVKPGMSKEEIKMTQRMAQKLLEKLQGEEASFMLIGDEGNCFTLGGNPVHISAQIIFAMIRYPVVREIIGTCESQFNELNEKYGEDVRNMTLEHIIEINSGN